MSLKIKVPARLKAKFAGVALSKKSMDLLADKLAASGLTDESTDEEIDAKLDERNALWPFEDQKKYDDYQAGKAAKDKADLEAKEKKESATVKPEDEKPNPDETPTEKLLKQALAGITTLTAEIASIKGEKVTNTRRQSYIDSLKGTSKEYQDRELKKFDRMKFETEDEFNEFLVEAKDLHADAVQEDTNDSLGNDKPAGNNSKGDVKVTDEAVEAAVDAIL